MGAEAAERITPTKSTGPVAVHHALDAAWDAGERGVRLRADLGQGEPCGHIASRRPADRAEAHPVEAVPPRMRAHSQRPARRTISTAVG